ncbi:MAG: trypsin-like peptidase domain-containing protein [Acidobacteria bacterium]|nr:trypsin-like peptidase domain-containing protein [Acidobacteriota bacterium]
MRFFLALSFCLGLDAKEPDIPAMKAYTVKILVRSSLTGPGGATATLNSHGSGYLVSDRHVVTNNHVCCRTERDGYPISSTELSVHTSRNAYAGARVLWSSPAKDLAVLELEKPLDKPAVLLAAPDNIKDGSRVWAVGFPGAAESQAASAESNFIPVVTHGIIGKFVEKSLGPGSPLIHAIDHSAPVNPGNSGGPLFNVCGQVVGTNHAKASSAAVEGIYWAIDNRELLGELERLKVPVRTAPEACSEDEAAPVQTSSVHWTQVVSIGLGLVAIALAMNKNVRRSVSKRLTTRRTVPDREYPPAARPVLRGVNGYYAGSAVPLEDAEWVIGRDTQVSNLVLPPEQASVSKRHCILRYDAATRKVYLEDTWSSNGTFLSTGTKLDPGRPYELRTGDRFYLADTSCMFEIGSER